MSGFEKTFQEETAALQVERAQLLIGSAIFIYAGFWFLDRLVAPDLAGKFLLIRTVVCGFYLVSLLLLRTRLAERLARPLVFVGGVLSAAGISEMAAEMGGYASNYFVGNMIVIVAVGYFMPWSTRVVACFLTAAIATYPLQLVPRHGPSKEMLAPLFFLVGMAVFTYVASVFSFRDRRRDLSLRLRLENANRKLQEVNEAKSRFFANVSHELRTPLTMILGPVETLLKTESHEGQRLLLESVLSNSRRLLRQVNLLLDSAKMESGRLTLQPSKGELSEVVRELVKASKPHALKRDLTLSVMGLERIESSDFDHDKMEMVAANLLSNALKFTPSGGQIEIRGFSGDHSVGFEVSDTGHGIPEDQLESIFQRFHQVDTSLSRAEGTGLGLALAKELVRLHGGTLAVSSAVGRGSTFRVELPKGMRISGQDRRQKQRRREDKLLQARAESLTVREYEVRARRDLLLADLRAPQSKTTAPKTVLSQNAPRILIVDDNPDLREFLAQQLSPHYHIETAGDGAEGLEKARKTRPALIVADVMMPIMDGYQLCRRLKADAGFAATPIILVTAKAGSEAVVEGLEIGADDYVTKPFSPEELKARIGAHLRAKDTERQLHEKESRLAAIGELTSGVVHDVRNTLMLIKGHSDLARAAAVEGGSLEGLLVDLDEIGRAAGRLQRMSGEILEYARGGGELNKEVVKAADYLTRTLGSLEMHLVGQGIEATIEIDVPEEVRVRIDGDRFRRVIENLVFNARDALMEQEGDKKIMVQAFYRRETIEVRVADSGPGIAPEILGRLFEPFATRKSRGTGLGLTIVRNLVKAHGGDVRVEPQAPEGGAAFTVVVPVEN